VTWASESSNQPIVQPLYYAHHMFAVATRMNAALVKTSYDHSVAPFLKVWSSLNKQELNIVFLHKNDTAQSVTVSLNVTALTNNFKFPVGELSMLTAPSLAEQFNVTFAGRTWMNTKEGEPIGERKTTSIVPKTDPSGAFAVYTVTVMPASGALLNIKMNQQQHRHSRFDRK
jgi:hypothetical protein